MCCPVLQGESRPDLQAELASVRDERLLVMDEICDLLSDISPSQITAVFKVNAGRVQKKLAIRLVG